MKKLSLDRGIIGPTLAMLVIAAALSGCASSFDLRKNIPWANGDDKIQEPLKLTVFWSNEVENRSDRDHGIRGFGGRLYFYGKKPDKAVKVKGDLVVYAFDENNRDPKNVVPDKKYVFKKEMLEKLYSKSSMGHSYSVWLPWDDVGGPQHEITLTARFTSDGGAMVASDPSKQLLPGSGEMPAVALQPAGSNTTGNFVQQASYLAANAQASGGGVGLAPAAAALPSVKVASFDQTQGAVQAATAAPEGSMAITTIPVPNGILSHPSMPAHTGMPGPAPYQPPAAMSAGVQSPPGQSGPPPVVFPTPASMMPSPADPNSLKAGEQRAATNPMPTLNSPVQTVPGQMMATNSVPTGYSTPSGLPPVSLMQSPATTQTLPAARSELGTPQAPASQLVQPGLDRGLSPQSLAAQPSFPPIAR